MFCGGKLVDSQYNKTGFISTNLLIIANGGGKIISNLFGFDNPRDLTSA
jgi:hypothetical protein